MRTLSQRGIHTEACGKSSAGRAQQHARRDRIGACARSLILRAFALAPPGRCCPFRGCTNARHPGRCRVISRARFVGYPGRLSCFLRPQSPKRWGEGPHNNSE